MELDKTSIVLRQRSLLELIDLSLIVLRVYGRRLIGKALLGVIPFVIINILILHSMTDYEKLITFNYQFIDETSLRIRYFMFMASLILVEAPLALLGVTYFLGQAVFIEQPSMKEFGSVVSRSWFAILWLLGILRLCIVGPLLCILPAMSEENWEPGMEIFLYGFVLGGIAMAIRAFRPFAPELLVLERSPLFSKKAKDKPTSFGSRSRWLHQAISGELIGRFMAMTMAMLALLTSLTLSELAIGGIFFGDWSWGWWMDWILFPLNVWIIALWSAVFRLLSYLDCRTRLEGWELELRLKAEAARLLGGVS